MTRTLQTIIAFFFLSTTAYASSTGQKPLVFVNDTPYQILEFSIWPQGYGVVSDDLRLDADNPLGSGKQPVTGGMDPWQIIEPYVDEKECVFIVSAITGEGKIFSGEIDTCNGPSVWILRSAISL